MKKKMLSMVLALVLAMMMTACGASKEEVAETQTLDVSTLQGVRVEIGKTGYSVSVPSEYVLSEVSGDVKPENQIAYYKSNTHEMEFEFYLIPGEGRDLRQLTIDETTAFGGDGFNTISINNVDVTCYYNTVEKDGATCDTVCYSFAAEEDFGQILFYKKGQDAQVLIDYIINSLQAAQ